MRALIEVQRKVNSKYISPGPVTSSLNTEAWSSPRLHNRGTIAIVGQLRVMPPFY